MRKINLSSVYYAAVCRRGHGAIALCKAPWRGRVVWGIEDSALAMVMVIPGCGGQEMDMDMEMLARSRSNSYLGISFGCGEAFLQILQYLPSPPSESTLVLVWRSAARHRLYDAISRRDKLS